MKTEEKAKPNNSLSPMQWFLYVPLHLASIVALFYISTAYTVFRDYNPNFRFEYGVTSLSTFLPPVIVVITYVIGIPSLEKFMKNREAMTLRPYCVVHNIFLSASSLILFVMLSYIVINSLHTTDFYGTICSEEMHDNGLLHLVYYANYLLKYYELIDTVLLVLKKKPVDTLHFYHHAATLLLVYTQLVFKDTVQWVPIVINLLVHVIMYYYYFLTSIGVRGIWWKKYLTVFQIIQFVIDLIACWFAYLSKLFAKRGCYGEHLGAISGVAIITSYLFLFLDFFKRTYKPKEKKL